MKTLVEKRIQEILADHWIECLTDDKGKTVTIWKQLNGKEIIRHKSLFSAACYFAPLIRDHRLTAIVAV